MDNIEKLITEYTPDGKYIPLKITFNMTTPICLAHPWINFDGLIAHILLRKLLGNLYRLLPSKLPIDMSCLNLPIATYKKNNIMLYKCSVSFFDNPTYAVTKIYKRFYTKGLPMTNIKTKKISRGSGMFRDHAMTLPILPTKTVIFYTVGIKEELKILLNALPGIGKKTAIGFGNFSNIELTEINEDKSIISNGKAMRPIPVDVVEPQNNTEIVYLAYKFPYWNKQNVLPCVPPGSPVKKLL